MRADGLSRADVLTICRSGAVVEAPEQDMRTGDWKYRIEGKTLQADYAAVVFTFRGESDAVLITVFRRN